MPKVNPAQVKEFAFGGVQRGVNTKLVKAPNLLKADNVDMSNEGEVRKRQGLITDSAASDVSGVVAHNELQEREEFVSADNARYFSVRDAALSFVGTATDRDRATAHLSTYDSAADAEERTYSGWSETFVSSMTGSLGYGGTAADAGVVFYRSGLNNPFYDRIFACWSDADGRHWTLCTAEPGNISVLKKGTIPNAGGDTRILLTDDYVHVLCRSTTNTLLNTRIAVGTGAAATGTLPNYSVLAGSNWDATVVGGNFYVVGPDTATGNMRFSKCSSSSVSSVISSAVFGVASPGASIFGFNSAINGYVVGTLYTTGGGATQFTAWDGNITFFGASAVFASSGSYLTGAHSSIDTGELILARSVAAAASGATWTRATEFVTATFDGTTFTPAGSSKTIYGVYPASRFSTDGTRIVLEHYGHTGTQQRTALLCAITKNNAGLEIDPDPITATLTRSSNIDSYTSLPHLTETTTEFYNRDYSINAQVKSYLYPALKRIRGAGFSGSVVPVCVFTLEGLPPPTLALGRELLVGGGKPHRLGNAASHLHTHFYPEIVPVTLTAAGGNLSAGTYGYCAVVEMVSADGDRYISPPSSITTVTATALDRGDVSVQLPPFTPSSASVVLYRTTVDASVFHRIRTLDPGTAVAGVLTYNDTLADSSIATNETLYTTGGLLDNISVPPLHVMARYGSRVAGASNEAPDRVYLSKEIEYGEVLFNDALSVEVPALGVVTGIAEMANVLVVAGTGGFTGILGAGYTNAGTGPGWAVQVFSSEFGNDHKEACVKTPLGITAQQGGEMFLFDTNFTKNTKFFEPIEAYVNGENIRRAHYDKRTNTLYIITGSGATCLHSFDTGRWSRQPEHTFLDCTTWKRGFVGLENDNTIRKENNKSTDTVDYSLDVETGWVKMGELTQEMRAFWLDFLFEYRSSHTLNIDIYYDYEETSSETHTFVAASDLDPYRVRVKPLRERCVAVRVRIYDTNTATPYESLRLVGWSVEFDSSNALGRLPAAQTVA